MSAGFRGPLAFWMGGAQYVSGPVVPTVPTSRQLGAGKSRKQRRKLVVTVDGQDYYVSSEAEAEAVLETAKDEARKLADQVIARSAEARIRPLRKIVSDARKTLQSPRIEVSGIPESIATAATADIESLFKAALQTVEIAALMRAQLEADDEEALILLMML